jgi:hypothetical protein
VKEWLQLFGETVDVLEFFYVFAFQCKNKGHEVKGEEMVFVLGGSLASK